ncbi:hypothetical protein [Altibacter lentus]|uniref:hypothetical protein n=1 Tax=Altibacter lentus TaxID=1223410 RepID=UPI000ADBD18A|nr:hypothetical protein [Altibacter lentus]
MLRSLLVILYWTPILTAQVGIGTTAPDPSSALDITATDKGILTPRMTTAQRNSIANPANGLMIYNTDSDEFQYNSNNSSTPAWRALSLISTSATAPGSSLKYSNTDITTNINQASVINLPVFGNSLWNDDTGLYVVSGNQLTITQAGRYEFIINASIANNTATDRNAPEMRLYINGTAAGAYASTGYMRSANNHEQSSLHLREVLELNANDIVTVGIGRAGNSGSVLLRSTGSTTFYVEKKL